MNPKQNLIMVKGVDRTDDILRITREGGQRVVTYQGGKSYRYALHNIEWLSHPKRIPVQNSIVFFNDDVLSGVQEVLRFKQWVKVFHSNGRSRCFLFSQLSVQHALSFSKGSADIFAYFRELAEQSSLQNNEGDSLLAKKYKQLDTVSHRSVLSRFLYPNHVHSELDLAEPPPDSIFPFGCNMSQKTAVNRSIQHPVSLIQGPPGTGKTQTILNLIANLLIQKKRVAVVSNNNASIENVIDKLNKYELGFVTAFLGNAGNKESFIDQQTAEVIKMPTLDVSQKDPTRQEIIRLNEELDTAFTKKNQLAEITQQIDGIRLEFSHFEAFQKEVNNTQSHSDRRDFQPSVSAKRLMSAWIHYERKLLPTTDTDSTTSTDDHIGLLDKLGLLIRLGLAGRALFNLSLKDRIALLQRAYYRRKLSDLEARKAQLERALHSFRFDQRLERLTDLSMQFLKDSLAQHYNNRTRRLFELDDLWQRTENFLEEYPVVLSTTFSVITSVEKGYLFDYVIVDEASQVDLLNGVLAMGCAMRMVVVGDTMQLPNVLTEEDRGRAVEIGQKYDLPHYALFEKHSLLTAMRRAFPEAPETMLLEHYRCHPKIIQFCNQKFYGGKLLVMTKDEGEPDVLKAYVTVEGRHARGTFNQRQIDEVIQTILPELEPIHPNDIGIVSPYREQTIRMQASAGSRELEIDTVHKYQGREKRVMIITTVANESNPFVDDPHLLNVAVSRAQEKLRLVVSKEMAEGQSNIADFVRYIRYNNCEVVPGKVRSIFDFLYRDYTKARLNVLKTRKRVSKYDSENLAYGAIATVLEETAYQGYGLVFQLPLSMLIQDTDHLSPEESRYANHPWTRIDFLIYRKVDKVPVLAIEVDGYAFHREGTRQAERDALKDSLLIKCGLPILRLSTIGSNERNRIKNELDEVAIDKDKDKPNVSL